MSDTNQMLLFEHIPYNIRRTDLGHYSIKEIENILLDAFHESFITQYDIAYVYVDNKYHGQTILVTTYKGTYIDKETVTLKMFESMDWLDENQYHISVKYLTSDILPKDNIIKKACKKLGYTQNELAYILGVKEQSLRNMISKNKFTTQISKSIDLLLRNDKLEKQLEDCSTFKKSLQNFMGITPQTNKSNQETKQ